MRMILKKTELTYRKRGRINLTFNNLFEGSSPSLAAEILTGV